MPDSAATPRWRAFGRPRGGPGRTCLRTPADVATGQTCLRGQWSAIGDSDTGLRAATCCTPCHSRRNPLAATLKSQRGWQSACCAASDQHTHLPRHSAVHDIVVAPSATVFAERTVHLLRMRTTAHSVWVSLCTRDVFSGRRRGACCASEEGTRAPSTRAVGLRAGAWAWGKPRRRRHGMTRRRSHRRATW